MKHDRSTGRLDLKNKTIIKDPQSVKRLMAANMIFADGKLTPEAKKRCDLLIKQLFKSERFGSESSKQLHDVKRRQQGDKKTTSLTASDWAVLYKYDRKSGNLLKYDPQTGQLDESSRAILRNPSTLQRLIDHKLVIPGGWLTSKAKEECARIQQKLETQAANGYAEPVPKDNIQSKSPSFHQKKDYPQPISNDISEPGQKSKKNLSKLLANEDLQAFFENLPGDEKNQVRVTVETRNPPVENSELTEAIRDDHKRILSKDEPKNGDKAGRRKKGPDSTDGDIPEPPSISLRDVLHVVFKRKIQILVFFAAVVTAVVIGTLLTNPKYEATAQILVKLGRESIFIPVTGESGPVINFDREERINSEIEILNSRALTEKMVAQIGPTTIYPGLKEDSPGLLRRLLGGGDADASADEKRALRFEIAIDIFQKALAVEGIKKSNVIQISFKHENPRMAALVVNKLADIYLAHHVSVHKAPKSVKFFKDQSQLLRAKMERSEEELKALKKRYNIANLEEERSLLLQQSAALRAELNSTLSQKVEAEKRIGQLRQQIASTSRTVPQGEVSDQNPFLISTLEARLVELQLQEKKLLAKYTDKSRPVTNIREEIHIVSQKLTEQEDKRYGRTSTGLNPTYQNLQQTLLENEAELKAIKAKAEIQQVHLTVYQNQLDKLNQIEVDLNQLQQQVDVNRENYRLYLTKFEESRISDAMDSEKITNVSLIEPARVPRKPVSPKKRLNLILAIFIGAFGGLGLAFFREYLDDKIEKVEDVEDALGIPVLASLPEMEKEQGL
jgi:uncharacterized protein involved in exopolysaccharide biosynthesis